MTIKEYARSRGVSHVTIVNKFKRGVLSSRSLVTVPGQKRKKIDSEIADLELDLNGDKAKQVAQSVNPRPKKGENGEEIAPDETLEKYREAKFSTETLKARKLELEVLAKEGELLNAEDVRRTIVKLVSETREILLNIPPKIAPVLVSITDVLEMENKLYEEINFALANLSRLEK